MTTEERLDRLTGVVDALASTVVAHDNQIEDLIRVAEKQAAAIAAIAANTEKAAAETQALRTLVMDTVRQWQAYINTRPAH